MEWKNRLWNKLDIEINIDIGDIYICIHLNHVVFCALFFSATVFSLYAISILSHQDAFRNPWIGDTSGLQLPGSPFLRVLCRDPSAPELLITPSPTRYTSDELMRRQDISGGKDSIFISGIQSSLPHLPCILLMTQQLNILSLWVK